MDGWDAATEGAWAAMLRSPEEVKGIDVRAGRLALSSRTLQRLARRPVKQVPPSNAVVRNLPRGV